MQWARSLTTECNVASHERSLLSASQPSPPPLLRSVLIPFDAIVQATSKYAGLYAALWLAHTQEAMIGVRRPHERRYATPCARASPRSRILPGECRDHNSKRREKGTPSSRPPLCTISLSTQEGISTPATRRLNPLLSPASQTVCTHLPGCCIQSRACPPDSERLHHGWMRSRLRGRHRR